MKKHSKQQAKTQLDQLNLIKQKIKQTNQKLTNLKNIKNPQIVQSIRTTQKYIKKLQSTNLIISMQYQVHNYMNRNQIDRQKNSKNKRFNKPENNLNPIDFPKKQIIETKYSINEQLNQLKNAIIRQFSNVQNQKINSEKQNESLQKDDHINLKQQFKLLILKNQAQISSSVQEIFTYSWLSKYLNQKKSYVFEKLLLLNPDKRASKDILFVSHQRVILKEHLDWLRKLNQNLKQQNQQLKNQCSDFEMVKAKYLESFVKLKMIK